MRWARFSSRPDDPPNVCEGCLPVLQELRPTIATKATSVRACNQVMVAIKLYEAASNRGDRVKVALAGQRALVMFL